MNTLNFDLQLQFSNYLYDNYPRVLLKISEIDKDLYPAILYIMRKYRDTNLKVRVELFDKNNIVLDQNHYLFLARNGYYDVIKENINIGNLIFSNVEAILSEAVNHNRPKIVKLLLTSYKNNNNNELVKTNTKFFIRKLVKNKKFTPNNYMMKILIKYGGNHNYANLITNVMSNNKRGNLDLIIKYLIHYTNNKDYINYLSSAFMNDGNNGIIKYLIDLLSPLDLKDFITGEVHITEAEYEMRPFTNLLEYIQYLIDNDNSNRDYNQAIINAASYANYDVIELLLKYNQGPKHFKVAINYLASYNNFDMIRILDALNTGDRDYIYGILETIKTGNFEIFKYLLSHSTATKYREIIKQSILKNYLNMTQHLLENYLTHPRDYNEYITQFAETGNIYMIKLLHRYNKNKDYTTAIYKADTHGYSEISQFLRQA